MPDEFWLQLVMEPFINQFKRDDAKYEERAERNRINGSKGGRPNNPQEPRETQITQSVISQPKKADNDNDNDNDSVSDSDNGSVSVNNNNTKPEKVFSADGLAFANWFNKELKPDSVKPTDADLKKWAATYDDLIRIDGKTKEQIANAVKWARNDDFWSKNFLSPLKLRSKNRDGVKYIDVFIERSLVPEKKETPKANIDPQFGYDTSKPGVGKIYNPQIGKFLYPSNYTGERV